MGVVHASCRPEEGTHLEANALARADLNLPARPARATGMSPAGAVGGLCAAGMRRFAGATTAPSFEHRPCSRPWTRARLPALDSHGERRRHVWATLITIEEWWLPLEPRAPEHRPRPRRPRPRGRNPVPHPRKIAGVPGEGIGAITQLDAGTSVSWQTPRRRYRLGGAPVMISEGVTWRSEPAGNDQSQPSALVSARFPTDPSAEPCGSSSPASSTESVRTVNTPGQNSSTSATGCRRHDRLSVATMLQLHT